MGEVDVGQIGYLIRDRPSTLTTSASPCHYTLDLSRNYCTFSVLLVNVWVYFTLLSDIYQNKSRDSSLGPMWFELEHDPIFTPNVSWCAGTSICGHCLIQMLDCWVFDPEIPIHSPLIPLSDWKPNLAEPCHCSVVIMQRLTQQMFLWFAI